MQDLFTGFGLAILTGVLCVYVVLVLLFRSFLQPAAMDRIEALMDACHKRAQPIVMTTIAMGAGMLPTALGIGGDASFRGPMTIAVIGGLITSTFLSLLVIPVVFTYVDDLLAWWARDRAGRSNRTNITVASPSQ
uniref:efflux RND transporter permease subunit n=1 Tax=Duganella vulcania TaxID=2692166 RepID=UPI0035A3B5B3